jgi:hypothetical protein
MGRIAALSDAGRTLEFENVKVEPRQKQEYQNADEEFIVAVRIGKQKNDDDKQDDVIQFQVFKKSRKDAVAMACGSIRNQTFTGFVRKRYGAETPVIHNMSPLRTGIFVSLGE